MLQEALEGIAHIPRRQPAAVVETNILAQDEIVSPAILLHPELTREPGDDAGPTDVPGQPLVDVRQHLGLLHRIGQRRVEALQSRGHRHLEDP